MGKQSKFRQASNKLKPFLLIHREISYHIISQLQLCVVCGQRSPQPVASSMHPQSFANNYTPEATDPTASNVSDHRKQRDLQMTSRPPIYGKLSFNLQTPLSAPQKKQIKSHIQTKWEIFLCKCCVIDCSLVEHRVIFFFLISYHIIFKF